MNRPLLLISLFLTATLAACSTPVDLDESAADTSSQTERDDTTATQASNTAMDGSPSDSAMTGDSEHRCDADPAQQFVGESGSSELESQVKEATGSKQVRTLRPDDVITMEYNPERINLRLDDDGVITSIGCG